MARSSDLAKVVADTRLSAEARIAVLLVATKGRGPHEISFTEWSILLNQASEKRVRTALRMAVHTGWLERIPGGRGHADSYAFRVPATDTLKADRVPAEDKLSTDSLPAEGNLNPDSLPQGGTLSDSLPVAGTLKDSLPTEGTLNALTRVDARTAVEVVDEVEDDPPVVPPTLAPRAEAAIEQHAELLRGCRGALRDYLASRVSPRRQYAYVQTVAAWLQADTASPFYGTPAGGLPPPERTKVLATALNELAAAEEEKMSRPVGDVGNLRTKIRILLRDWTHEPRHNGGSRDHGRGAPAQGGRGSSTGGEYDHLG